MKITEFTKEVTLVEGLKVQVSIAQVAEILKIVNKYTSGALYKEIKKL
jgi:hypothetical protein